MYPFHIKTCCNTFLRVTVPSFGSFEKWSNRNDENNLRYLRYPNVCDAVFVVMLLAEIKHIE